MVGTPHVPTARVTLQVEEQTKTQKVPARGVCRLHDTFGSLSLRHSLGPHWLLSAKLPEHAAAISERIPATQRATGRSPHTSAGFYGMMKYILVRVIEGWSPLK